MVPRRALEVVHTCTTPEAGGCGEPAPSRKGHTTKRAAGAPFLTVLEEQCKDQLLPAADLNFAYIKFSKPHSSQEEGSPWMQPVP